MLQRGSTSTAQATAPRLLRGTLSCNAGRRLQPMVPLAEIANNCESFCPMLAMIPFETPMFLVLINAAARVPCKTVSTCQKAGPLYDAALGPLSHTQSTCPPTAGARGSSPERSHTRAAPLSAVLDTESSPTPFQEYGIADLVLVHQEADDAVGRLAVHALPLARARHLRIAERDDMQPSQVQGHKYWLENVEGQAVETNASQEDWRGTGTHLHDLGQVMHKQEAASFEDVLGQTVISSNMQSGRWAGGAPARPWAGRARAGSRARPAAPPRVPRARPARRCPASSAARGPFPAPGKERHQDSEIRLKC